MTQSSVKPFFAILTLSLLLASCGKEADSLQKPSDARTTNTAQNAEARTNAAATATATTNTNAAKPIEFPKDEGAHYEKPIEWWYMNSQLIDANGKEYTFFFCILSTGRHLVSLYDKAADQVLVKDYYESLTTTQNTLLLTSPSLKWQQDGAPFRSQLAYAYEGLTVNLKTKSNRKPLLPNGNGFINMGLKGTSHYYALTDLIVEGTIDMGTKPLKVKGKGWLDHQWGEWDWVNDFSQWKWYAVKLDNGVDLMLFNIYKDKVLINSYCGYIDAANNQQHQLKCELITKKYYEDASGGKWQKVVELKIPSLPNTTLTLTSDKDLQFIEKEVLWEGSMTAEGTFKGVPVKGLAYGELNRPD